MLQKFFVFLSVALGIASVAMAEPREQWSGFYTGVTLNYASGDSDVLGNRFTFNQNQALNRVNHAYQGVGGGGFIGWNYRNGNRVFGGEFSLSVADLESQVVFNGDNDIDQVEIQWSGDFVGRYGVIFGNTLVYAKGGVSFARIRNIGGDVNGGALTLSDAHIQNDLTFGPTLGVGAERFFSKNWLLRLEYSLTDFGNFTQFNQDGAPNSQFYEIDNGPVQKLSLGVAFQF